MEHRLKPEIPNPEATEKVSTSDLILDAAERVVARDGAHRVEDPLHHEVINRNLGQAVRRRGWKGRHHLI